MYQKSGGVYVARRRFRVNGQVSESARAAKALTHGAMDLRLDLGLRGLAVKSNVKKLRVFE